MSDKGENGVQAKEKEEAQSPSTNPAQMVTTPRLPTKLEHSDLSNEKKTSDKK